MLGTPLHAETAKPAISQEKGRKNRGERGEDSSWEPQTQVER